MKALFLIFHGFNEANGISKKIRYQVKARAEISDHFVIHHPTPFAIRGHIIMTQANIHSTIFEEEKQFEKEKTE